MQKGSWYRLFLIAAFLAVWVWAAINPLYRHDWLLENYLVFIFVPIILIVGYYFKLSNLSYTLITIFMIFHVIGSHYTYAEVPFGYVLQSWFHANRNMYDRVIHFSFGLLLFYPMREVFSRLAKSKGFWGYWFPVELILAFSAIYEIIEWIIAINVNPTAGLAFLGSQGDIWDTQKDMFMAFLGALVTALITLTINFIFNKKFWEEMKSSFRVPKGDKPLGEVKLRELIRGK